MFTTLVVLFYLLVSGEIFLRRLVEVLPGFGKKRQAVEISLSIEQNISAYLLTVTLINVVVGLAVMVIMWSLRVDDPLLWGVIAFVVNYVPILGPACGIVVFTMAGIVSLGSRWYALLPAGLYFCVHVMEGEIFTPMLLARRFTINPVAVILALIFWYLDVGRCGRDPRRADARDHQNHLRRHPAAPGTRSLPGGLDPAGQPDQHLGGGIRDPQPRLAQNVEAQDHVEDKAACRSANRERYIPEHQRPEAQFREPAWAEGERRAPKPKRARPRRGIP